MAAAAGEPLTGTASARRRRWLLVEQPGPWGPEALVNSGLDLRVARELQRGAKAAGVHVQLIRRPGGSPPGRGRVCYLAATDRGSARLERVDFDSDDPEQLLKLDLDALAAGQASAAGTPVERPIYLVCTHGRRDTCCAVHGRPLVDAVASVAGPRVWETSHVGGHRFAGNLVCFPDGLYLGRLGPADGVRAVELYERGRILVSHLRGRSSDHWAAQVADWWARDQFNLDRVDDLAIDGLAEEGELVRVQVAIRDGSRWTVSVRRLPTGRLLPQSCGAEPEDSGERRVVDVTRIA
jgi:hypothetical protein